MKETATTINGGNWEARGGGMFFLYLKIIFECSHFTKRLPTLPECTSQSNNKKGFLYIGAMSYN